MSRIRFVSAAVLVGALAVAPAVFSRTQAAQDKEAVRQVGLDYVEAIYNVQPERIERSVHPTLVKRGFSRRQPGGPYVETTMTYDQLVNVARNWNKEGKRDTSVKKVEILDIADQTAVVKITAFWGIDHMLLGKYDGKWKISLIQWQSPPPKS